MRSLLSAVVLALLGLLATAVPAAAADQPLEVSRDGRSWSHSLTGGVFDSRVRWVPGDTRVVSFHVRNGGESSAAFSLAALSDDADRLFARGLVKIRARVDRHHWIAVEDLDRDYRLSSLTLPVAGSARVQVGMTFVDTADNTTQDQTFPLDFRLRLTDAVAVAGEEVSGVSGGGIEIGGTASSGGPKPSGVTPPAIGVLPATGAPEIRGTLVGAAALVGVGLALLMGRRRQDDEEETSHAAS